MVLNRTGPQDPLVALFTVVALLTAVLLPLCLFLELAFRISPAREVLEEARDHGDRRLRTALERRSGALLPYPAHWIAAILGVTLFLPYFFRDVRELLAAGEVAKLLVPLFTLPVVSLAGMVFFYPLLWIPEKLIGSQRILVRRMEASLSRGEEKKPLPPGP